MALWRSHLLRLLLVCLAGGLLSPILFTSRALAASNPITVTSQTETVTFPRSIDFQVSATDSSSPIREALLTIIFFPVGAEQHQVTVNNPAQMLTLHWHEDTSGNDFNPAGTQISYHWDFVDETGGSYSGPTQTFTVTDTRFSWQHLSQNMLQVDWYNRSQSFGQAVLSDASAAIQRISANLGGGLSHPVNLWIYQTDQDFQGSLPPQTHEWVGGVAFPELDQAEIVVGSMADQTLIRDMPHELTHLIFHQLIGPDASVPTWFDEGLAVYNQQYHEPEMALRLREGLATHDLLRLNDISSSFPADTSQAYLAYAESWNLMSYMYSTFGRARMTTLIKDIGTGMSFGQDLVKALGEDQDHLENQWRLSLHQPPIPLANQAPKQQPVQSALPSTTDKSAPLLLLLAVLLIMLPLLGLGGIFAYQRRRRTAVPYSPVAFPPYGAIPPPAGYRPPPNQPLPGYQAYPQPFPQRSPAYQPPPRAAHTSPYYSAVPGSMPQRRVAEAPPLGPTQEYMPQRLKQQAPQE
jgi:hypothetical protein